MRQATWAGVDLSLTHSCIVLVRKSQNGKETVKVVDVKTKPDEFQNDVDRIIYIANRVVDTMSEQAPSAICIEAPALLARGRSVNQIFGLNMVVRVFLRQSGHLFYDVMPAELKKFACGKGNADKSLVVRDVFKRFDYEAGSNDEADAYILAQIAKRLSCGRLPGDVSFQNEVVEKVLERSLS